MVRAGLGAGGRPAGWGGERPGQVTARDEKETRPTALGCPGEDPSPPRVLQASRKAGTRGKATATKQAQRGSSNVFSMFEQAQIQEFKEVSALPPDTLFYVTRGSGLCPCPRTPLLPAFTGAGAAPTGDCDLPPHRPSAALTRTVMASSASLTFGRPTPSWVSAPTAPLHPLLSRGLQRGAPCYFRPSSLPPLPSHVTLAAHPPPRAAPTLHPMLGKEERAT